MRQSKPRFLPSGHLLLRQRLLLLGLLFSQQTQFAATPTAKASDCCRTSSVINIKFNLQLRRPKNAKVSSISIISNMLLIQQQPRSPETQQHVATGTATARLISTALLSCSPPGSAANRCESSPALSAASAAAAASASVDVAGGGIKALAPASG